MAPGRRVDFGFDALVRDDALARDAVAGQAGHAAPRRVRFPRTTAWTRISSRGRSAEEVRRALKAKGYRETETRRATRARSDRAGGGDDRVPRGIYPHHALAIDERGVVTSVLVTGRSNREGTTIRDLAAALAKSGAEAAILLDNGGDVGSAAEGAAAPLTFARDRRRPTAR